MKRRALGTYDIAKICHVAPITIGRWIEEGKLPFFTTGGGHRRVWDEDLVNFLHTHNYPIPKNLKSSLKIDVVVVDDDSVTRKLILRLFNKKFPHVQVHEAANGFEAGELISSLVPPLVILDIHLPGLDGFAVCQRIHQNKSLKKVKILAITGDGSESIKTRIMKAGAHAFLSKPFQEDTLIKLTSKLLGHK